MNISMHISHDKKNQQLNPQVNQQLHQPFQLMGILNTTPDSFSDGGRFYKNGQLDVSLILDAGEKMVRDGADILDVGGESSGPDSVSVSLEEELARVVPAVRALAAAFVHLPVVISVDTYKSEVARQAISVGATMINDVTAFRGDPDMASVIAQSGASVILMYSKNASARTTREVVHYQNVVKTILDFWKERIDFALRSGVKREQIFLDPGMGFFVSGDPRYSFEILERLDELVSFGFPVVLGPSRKSFLGGCPEDRSQKNISVCVDAFKKGVSILRIHDVRRVFEGIAEKCELLR